MPKCNCCNGDLPCDLQTGTKGNCCGSSQPEQQREPQKQQKQPEDQAGASAK